MKIFDKHGTQMESPDMAKGYLTQDSLFVMHHEAAEAVKEVGHYETVREYPNGGKEVKWVVDVPGVEGREAWDEYEDILRYVEFTEAELAQRRIAELKEKLRDTDYAIIKVMEGAATLADYAELIAQRGCWRQEINRLEPLQMGDR